MSRTSVCPRTKPNGMKDMYIVIIPKHYLILWFDSGLVRERSLRENSWQKIHIYPSSQKRSILYEPLYPITFIFVSFRFVFCFVLFLVTMELSEKTPYVIKRSLYSCISFTFPSATIISIYVIINFIHCIKGSKRFFTPI